MSSELNALLELFIKDPQGFEKGLDTLPRSVMLELAEELQAVVAGEKPSVDSFKRIYQEFFGRPLPYVDEPVAEEFIWALENNKGVMYEAWRGKGKSTFFTAWGPSVMGWRPVGSTTLVRVNDQKGKEMGKAIAALIKTSPGWQKIFPHVIPDERAGWSVENGFNVMDTRVTGLPGSKNFEQNYAKWRMMCLSDHLSEQSLLCAGIESGSIIGLHPTNGMWFDDLHDEANTRSAAELKKVVDIFEGNIAATWIGAGGSPTLGVFCTPWSKNPPDVYQVMLATGRFKHIKMPVFVEDENGEEIPLQNEDGQQALPEWVGKKVKLTWPEAFPMARVIDMMHTYKTRFGQMALLNIELSKPKNMRYQEFPHTDIKWDWPMTDGVDPVATVAGISSGDGISHFALFHLLRTPYNSVVIGDGIVEKCDASTGEQYVVDSQRTYRNNLGVSVETNGAGAIFAGNITRHPGTKVHPHVVSELGQGSKKDRQYRFLQPLFANGSVLVSDADTSALNAVREYLDNFPNFDKDSYLWDVGDALAIGLLDIPEIWTRIVVSDSRRESVWERNRHKGLYHPLAGKVSNYEQRN